MHTAKPLYNEKRRRRTLLEELRMLCKKGRWQQALLALGNSNQALPTLGISCLTALTLIYGSTLIEILDAPHLLGNAISFFYRIVDGDIYEQGQFATIRRPKWFALLAVGSLNVKRRKTKNQEVRKGLKKRIRTAFTYQKNKPVQGTG
jgi:hypothetical protein